MNTRLTDPLTLALVLLLTSASIRAQGPTGVFERRFQFEGGSTVGGAGDVNLDGFDDFIVAEPWSSPGGVMHAGSATVYSGKDGTTLWQFDGESADNLLGYSVAGVGDVNQDGFPDVIVGARGADPGGRLEAGSAFVYSGRDGTVLWRFDGDAPGDWLGWSVSDAGDVNQDGFPDVVAGAPGYWRDGHVGSASVYSGRDGTRLWHFQTGNPGESFGWSVAGAGDVNGDGFSDVIVGAPHASQLPDFLLGSAFVYSGKDGTLLWRFDSDDPIATEYLGRSVDGAGDVDRDGFADLIVGVPNRNPSAPLAGSAHVYSGRDGSTLWEFHGEPGIDSFIGESVAGIGDVNQDGFPDMIVGAPLSDWRFRTGTAIVFSGKDGTRLWRFHGEVVSEHLGGYVASAGDVNADGIPDVIVGGLPVDSLPVYANVYVYEPAIRAYGQGLEGTDNIVPKIGTGGEVPRIGSQTFQVQVTDALGGVPCMIGVSLRRAEEQLLGGTLYGDFLTPGASVVVGMTTSGPDGVPGAGTATVPIPILYNPALIGFTTYWQGFVLDSGSPIPIGVSHTGGLAVTLLE